MKGLKEEEGVRRWEAVGKQKRGEGGRGRGGALYDIRVRRKRKG